MKRLISILICALVCASALGQEVEVKDYDALRTDTWSVWAGGGLGTVWGGSLMPNVSPSPGTGLSPYLELGVLYNFRPWMRRGLSYSFSAFQREASYDVLQEDGLTLRHLQALMHQVQYTWEFNLTNAFGSRNKRLNVYAGAGFGYRIVTGRDYGVSVGHTSWNDGNSLENQDWLKAANTDVSADGPYVPFRLNVEYDIVPRISLGGVVGYDQGLKKGFYLPGSRVYAGVVVRVNLVGKKQGYYTRGQQRDYYKDLYEKAEAGRQQSEDHARQLKDELDASKAKASRLSGEVDAAKARIAQLEGNQAKAQSVKDLINEAVIYFDRGSAKINASGASAISQIATFLKENPEYKLYLTGSASRDGSEELNLELSRERAQAVKKALVAHGIAEDRLVDEWVGAQGMTYDPSSRRVVFDLK